MTERRAEGPVCLVDVDAGGEPPRVPARASDGRPYVRAAVAVRVHRELVGVVDLPIHGEPDGGQLARLATAALRERIDDHLVADGLGPGVYSNCVQPRCQRDHKAFMARAPFATVVVASRDGEATLGDAIDSLLANEYPAFEIVVVDNASRGDGVRKLVESYADAARPVRYVREDRP